MQSQVSKKTVFSGVFRQLWSGLWVGAICCAVWLASVPSHAHTPKKPAPTSRPTSQKVITSKDVDAFLQKLEREMLALYVYRDRTGWLQNTYITHDTQVIAAESEAKMMAFVSQKMEEVKKFQGLKLTEKQTRKLRILRTFLSLPAPSNEKSRLELAQIASDLTAIYGKGKYYFPKKKKRLDLQELSAILAKSRDYDEQLEAWRGWRTISPPMRAKFVRYVELANAGARELGFTDLGQLWRQRYEMPRGGFEKEVERLWGQVKPLYDDLHCYVRSRLVEQYGDKKVEPKGKIPAHLLGNMWAQSWENLFSLVAPKTSSKGEDIGLLLKNKKVDRKGMVRYAEQFFRSLGMPALPPSFWQRSMFEKPKDHEAVCHASAWHIDLDNDVRLSQCIEITAEDFQTLHHELGHIYYYLGYRTQDILFREGAHNGFHEGIGDAVALSVTPSYLQKIGLATKDTKKPDDIAFLMQMALEKVAFLPFGRLIDKWRWEVFSGKIKPADYNKRWWELREKYQGIKAPIARSEKDFDPGAKYHIPANVPYIRYFLAAILQFQFHRSLCQEAGHKGPLHTCSNYGNKVAGQKLWKMLQAGASHHWSETLALLTGKREMDASAILTYFAPLHQWLKVQNKGRSCGW
ncbi:MAG: M2 family metallopeptidase [Myxococcales bacterium]|nr:M2 family metallopeptidase [Myxococcales bacterium]